jgi:predicted RNA-binding protein with PIN domain
MPLLIDGYNLLHVSGIFGQGTALTELHRSREALLRYLAALIEPGERSHTTIVFDAAGAPPGLPKTVQQEGITVHFARDYADADAMLESLIAVHETPRTLVVVSSDHRVQRAARRRRAKAIDSDRWLAELRANATARGVRPVDVLQKPSGDITSEEVQYWVTRFAEASPLPEESSLPARSTDDFENPFPPGYAQDLLDED